jgi:hypothetical protein
MDVQPREAVGRTGVFHITFLNQMSWPVDMALTAHDAENGLRVHIEPENPVVVPATGVAGPVTVRVAPRVRALLGEPHPYEIEFRSLDLGSLQQNELRARFVYVPRYCAGRLPVWLRRAPGRAVLFPLVLLLLLMVVAGGRALTRPATRSAVTPPTPAPTWTAITPPTPAPTWTAVTAPTPAPTWTVSSMPPTRPRATAQSFVPIPSIGRFTLVHGRRGQPYALVWQTRGAAHVTLDGRPVAARGHLVLPPPLHSATYRLVATSGARRATARLHVMVDALTSDPHAVVLRTPEIVTFTVRRRQGRLYATWRVRNAVHVWLQGRAVPHMGARRVPPGASGLRLVARNDVGSRQMLLPLGRLVPTATPRPTATPPVPPTGTPTRHPTQTPTPLPTVTPTARPTATFAPSPTSTPAIRPATVSTPRPTIPPTHTATPPATAAPTRRPTVTPLPIALRTMVPGFITTPPPLPSPVPSAALRKANAVDFGRQRVGTTSAGHTVDVVNPDPAPLTIRSVTITGNDAGDFTEADTCAGVTISPYGHCTISIRFTPRARGVRRASLVIGDNGAGGAWEVLLRGRGIKQRGRPT